MLIQYLLDSTYIVLEYTNTVIHTNGKKQYSFLNLRLFQVPELTKNRLVVGEMHYSSAKMYISCRSCYIMLLEIIKTSKIHNLFILYKNNTYFSALEFS
jgi:hypothetical protein